MDNTLEHGSMSNKSLAKESPVATLKDDTARQRWEYFHRAIAHAKQSNFSALEDSDADVSETEGPRPTLSIAR